LGEPIGYGIGEQNVSRIINCPSRLRTVRSGSARTQDQENADQSANCFHIPFHPLTISTRLVGQGK
jgi:hypothetical protein